MLPAPALLGAAFWVLVRYPQHHPGCLCPRWPVPGWGGSTSTACGESCGESGRLCGWLPAPGRTFSFSLRPSEVFSDSETCGVGEPGAPTPPWQSPAPTPVWRPHPLPRDGCEAGPSCRFPHARARRCGELGPANSRSRRVLTTVVSCRSLPMRGAAGVGSRRPPATALRLCPARPPCSRRACRLTRPAHRPPALTALSPHLWPPVQIPQRLPQPCPVRARPPPATPFSVAGPSEAPGLTLCFGLGPGPQRA